MKWAKKNHEFDDIGNYFVKNKQIYIYGAGDFGIALCKILSALNIPVSFVDRDVTKQQEGCLSIPVISPEEFFSLQKSHIVIVAASPKATDEIMNNLLNAGYEKNKSCFDKEYFCRYYLSIYAMYVYDTVYFDSIGFLSTTKCNLNCDACLNFTPYNKNQKHESFETLTKSLDDFFKCVNFVNLFSFTGGEPFLFPQVKELLSYIGDNYRNQINTLGISTNCTILPSDEILKTIKEHDFCLFLDDYTKYVPQSKKVLDALLVKLDDFGVCYFLNGGDDCGAYWIDLAPFDTDNSKMSDIELIGYHDVCHEPYQELRNSRLYSCNYASFAIKAGLLADSDNDWYDLSLFTPDKKRELIEFRMGYTKKGYVDFCKRCSGFITINKNIKPVGSQLIRKQ